jgi:hypothetical protein
MSMLNLLGLVFGNPSSVISGETITVCSIDGCMGEKLTPRFTGVVVQKTRIKCHGAPGDGKIPAVILRNQKTGETRTELSERLRTLEDGRKIVAN